jgi:hypothetical protein
MRCIHCHPFLSEVELAVDASDGVLHGSDGNVTRILKSRGSSLLHGFVVE